jgi:hypothetical protein
MVVDKLAITRAILAIEKPDYTEAQVQIALYRWWKNPRLSGGLRLTDEGDLAFRTADIEFCQFEDDKESWYKDSKYMLMLDKKMASPYHVSFRPGDMIVRIYDDSVSTLILLYGSVQDYVKNADDVNESRG